MVRRVKTIRKKYFQLFFLLGLIFVSSTASGSEIVLRLTGSSDFPGTLSLGDQGDRLGHVCFLGTDARGNLDDTFLESLAINKVPEGEYAITDPLPEERWPTPAFVKWGALRFAPRSKDTFGWFAKLGKRGLAVHGRDFYPLASKMTQNSKMVRFISDRLFEELVDGWGALRISNWDMGRLYDYHARFVEKPAEWKVRVVMSNLKEIQSTCEPLKVQRKPGGPLE